MAHGRQPTRAISYVIGATLPSVEITWRENGQLLDLTGHTFVLRVAKRPGESAVFEKTAGMVGAATAPNLVVTWALVAEVTTLESGIWTVDVIATRSSDGRIRRRQFDLRLEQPILAP